MVSDFLKASLLPKTAWLPAPIDLKRFTPKERKIISATSSRHPAQSIFRAPVHPYTRAPFT
jgi:hypothetical protein